MVKRTMGMAAMEVCASSWERAARPEAGNASPTPGRTRLWVTIHCTLALRETTKHSLRNHSPPCWVRTLWEDSPFILPPFQVGHNF